MTRKAKLIEFAGIDGSGKTTQLELTRKALAEQGYTVGTIKFPTYKGPVGTLITDMLNGHESVASPKARCAVYALDRLAHRNDLLELIDTCDVVLVDRYSLSQITNAAMSESHDDQMATMRFAEHMDFELIELPNPDLVIVIDVSVDVAQSRLSVRAEKDLVDTDVAVQQRARQLYWVASSARGSVKIALGEAAGNTLPQDELNQTVLNLIHSDAGLPAR